MTVIDWCCEAIIWSIIRFTLKIIQSATSKTYLMVSHSLTLDSWKVRTLRVELEFLTNFGSFYTFKGQNQLISKNLYVFLWKLLELLPFLNVDSNNMVKLARETRKVLCTPHFIEKFESWLERLNTPFVTYLVQE